MESMGRVGHKYALARPVGPQFPGSPGRSTPDSIAADPPYVDRTPILQGQYMSPNSVASALRLGSLGYMSRYSDLLSECREKVPHLQAVLSMRELAVAASDWQLVPADHGNKKRKNFKAAKIADVLTERIKKIPQFQDALVHLMGAVYFGRSGIEIDWKRTRDGLHVDALWGIHPKRLSYASNWRVHLWDENGNEYDPRLGRFPGVDIMSEYPDKFIIHTPRTMGVEIPTRQGLGRVLCWYALFWLWSQRDWMRFAEIFGQPWRVAFYDKVTADQDDIDAIKRALREMSVATIAALPNTTKFDIQQPSGRSTVHESLRNALNAEISKLVLGQTLTTDTSSKGGGAYALGQVHNEIRLDIKDNDGRALSETIQNYLIVPWVRREFGQDAVDRFCPIFQLRTQSEEDIDKEFTRTMAMVDRGVPVDVNDARERYSSLPRPETNHELMVPLAKVKDSPDPPDDTTPPPTSPSDGPKGSDGENDPPMTTDASEGLEEELADLDEREDEEQAGDEAA